MNSTVENMQVFFSEFGPSRGSIRSEKSQKFDLSRFQSDCFILVELLLEGAIHFEDIMISDSASSSPFDIPGTFNEREIDGELLIYQTLDEYGQSVSTDLRISSKYNNWATCIGLMVAICSPSGFTPVPTLEGEGLDLIGEEPLTKIAGLDFGVPKSFKEYSQRLIIFPDESKVPGTWTLLSSPETGYFATLGLLVSMISNILSSYLEDEEDEEAAGSVSGMFDLNLFDGEIQLSDLANDDVSANKLKNVNRAIVVLGKRGELDNFTRYEASSSTIFQDEVVHAAKMLMISLMQGVARHDR